MKVEIYNFLDNEKIFGLMFGMFSPEEVFVATIAGIVHSCTFFQRWKVARLR